MSKKQLFEEMKFDSYQYALDVKKDAEERLEKADSVFILSIIGTILGFCGPLSSLAIIIGIICYKKIGGLKKAFSWGWKLAKFGWFVVPIFPIDIAIGFAFLIFVPLSLLFYPVVHVYIFKRQAQKDIEQADEYLKYCKSFNEASNA